jgi:cytochrome c553
MNMNKTINILIVLSGLIFPLISSAAEFNGDAYLGRQKAQTCMTCHGPGGVSKYPSIPVLAGQQPLYIARQIRAFQNTLTKKPNALSTRKHPTMNNQVTILSNQDIDDIAAFFASEDCKPRQTQTGSTQASTTPKPVLRCLACHGRFGETGHYSLIPNLFGQNRDYLRNQLNAFYSTSGEVLDKYSKGERHHRIMSRQARFMDHNDINAIADYFSNSSCE